MDEHFQPDGANRLVVVRNGYVIWKGPDSDACQEIYSATKVFTSTVLGVLVGEGKCTLDTLAIEHLPELDDGFPLTRRSACAIWPR
jgi:CubicO group peptidase (beta-lactamase class C family)